jgi:diadenosine tetraphosphate (Ap4A) HIT family hydrolase
MAELHPQLARDCERVGRFPLCRLLLMRDANYPWLILVPDRDGVGEIVELAGPDREQLLRESCAVSEMLVERFRPDKLNLAALGNLVPQLHLHHVVRYRHDPAWPAPVWGRLPAKPYTPDALARRLGELREALNGRAGFVAVGELKSGE